MGNVAIIMLFGQMPGVNSFLSQIWRISSWHAILSINLESLITTIINHFVVIKLLSMKKKILKKIMANIAFYIH